MNNDNIRNAYDMISPSELAKARMYRNINTAAEAASAPRKMRSVKSKMVLVAAVIIGLIVSGFLFLSSGQHKIEESERRHRQEMAEQQEQTEEPHEND